MRRIWLIVGISAFFLALFVFGLVLQVAITSNYHIAVGDSSDGGWFNDWSRAWYGREFSQTLPTNRGAQADTYRWTREAADMHVDPLLPGVPYILRVRALSQIDGFEPAGMRIAANGRVLYQGMPPDQARLRTVSMLVPPTAFVNDSIPLTFGAINLMYPPDSRQLGLLVTDIHMSAVAPWSLRMGAALLWPWLALCLCVPVAIVWLLGSSLRTRAALVGAWFAVVAALIVWLPGRQLVHWLGAAVLLWALAALAQYVASRRAATIHVGRGALVLALVLAIAALALFRPEIDNDGIGYYAYVHSVIKDGDLRFNNEYENTRYADMGRRVTAGGFQPNQWAIGSSIAWAPAFGVAEVLTRGCQMVLARCPWQNDGYDMPYITLTMLVSLLAGLIAALLAYRYSVLVFGARPWSAMLAAIGIVFGSSWFYYMTRAPSLPHALSALATALLATHWLGSRPRTWRFWIITGILGGAVVLLYQVNALILIWPLLSFVWSLWDLRGTPRRLLHQLGYGLLAAAVAALVYSPQIATWFILYQRVSSPQSGGEAVPAGFMAYFASAFVSPIFGLFWWMPLLGVALALSPLFALMVPRPARREAALISVAIGTFIAYTTSLQVWSGGSGFGQRRLVVLAPLLIPVLAWVLQQLRRVWVGLPVFAVVLGSFWTWSIMVRFLYRLMPIDTHYLGQMRPNELLLTSTILPLPQFQQTFASSLLGTMLLFGQPQTIVLGVLVCCITAAALWMVLARFRTDFASPAQKATP